MSNFVLTTMIQMLAELAKKKTIIAECITTQSRQAFIMTAKFARGTSESKERET